MQIDLEQFRKPCTCGKTHEISVKGIWIDEGAVRHLYEMLTEEVELGTFIAPVIVWDENTREAAETAMEDIADICLEDICLESEDLHANNQGVAILDENLPEETDLLIAVGSGTIHDLCRYVAYHRGIPFVSVPTAASVDGFVSTVAAMTWNGMKKTMPAAAPLYVFADTNIFKEAPYRLTASGISDLLGKYIALADWKIAHLVTGEYLCQETCRLEYQALEEVLSCINYLNRGDSEAYEKLMYALLLSGLAMQMIGNSRPASCAEHHMSHLWEMEIINDHIDALHGEKVSVGMIQVRKRYERIVNAIRDGRCKVKEYEGMEEQLLQRTFGAKGLYEQTLEENTPDPMLLVSPFRLEEMLIPIADILDEIPSAKKLEKILKEADCCVSMEQIGLTDALVEDSLNLSPYVRNRLSFNRISKMLEYEV
ncbi:MAG: sn-glycerol-1-phosphate dehydrogenase [Lachnospiraceae bacterium]|nr:sn-glycerol-1-phosphate dehydrogenase [Lachnospiraceae bacterium]